MLLVIILSSLFKNQIYELSDWLCTVWGCAPFNLRYAGLILVWEKVEGKWLVFIVKCVGIWAQENFCHSCDWAELSHTLYSISQVKTPPQQQYLFSKCVLKWNVTALMNSFCSKTVCVWPNDNRPLSTQKTSIIKWCWTAKSHVIKNKKKPHQTNPH